MTVTRIQRGYACVPCHTRKKRCDGARPSCAGCTRSQIECEYSEIPGEISSHRQIRGLLERVDELERVMVDMGARSTQSSQAMSAGSPGSGSSVGSDSPMSSGLDPMSGNIAPWLQETLLATMIANRARYNLHINLSTLESPPEPLLIAMNLVACHILAQSAGLNTRPTSQDLDILKPLLLSKVYSGIHTSLENARDLLVGTVCAPALAAQYLLEVGRFAEAQWFASNAIRFAISSGIHTITSHRQTGANTPEPGHMASIPSGLVQAPNPSFLVPPRSPLEHHDRLMTWWLAYAADGLVEVVTDLPSASRVEILACLGDVETYLSGAVGIAATFPLPEHMYESGSNLDASSTSVSNLLLGDNFEDTGSQSAFSGLLKAITFYHAAVLIDDRLRMGGEIGSNTPKIFQNITTFIERVLITSSEAHGKDLDLTFACILAHAATIRLYAASVLAEDQDRRFEAAESIVRVCSTLNREEICARPQLLKGCCSEALLLLRPGGAIAESGGTRDFQALFNLIEQLEQIVGGNI